MFTSPLQQSLRRKWIASLQALYQQGNEREEPEEPSQPYACPICLRNISVDDPVALFSCGHVFGKACLELALGHQEGEAKRCPLCNMFVETDPSYLKIYL